MTEALGVKRGERSACCRGTPLTRVGELGLRVPRTTTAKCNY